jgi:catechol 2,3-dioxygenase-like lactoylglutathione lyase family enzyme
VTRDDLSNVPPSATAIMSHSLLIDHLDHLVLTTTDEGACVHFYSEVLGMRLEAFVGGNPPVERKSFKFGNQKINLHVKGREFEPKAHLPVPGALDLCFIAAVPLEVVVERLNAMRIPIVEGPVLRTGATSRIRSVYVRDPDLNLIEISEIVS